MRRVKSLPADKLPGDGDREDNGEKREEKDGWGDEPDSIRSLGGDEGIARRPEASN